MNSNHDMILMTIRISRSLLISSFLFGLLVALLYFLFSGRLFLFSFSSGICSCNLSIHTVDRWVVFDMIPYTYLAALMNTVISIMYAICTMPF